MGRLFGTDGVRGVPNRELTPELALRLGMAIATYLGSGARVLMGRDVRAGGDMLARAVAAGLIAGGVRVHDAGYAPTPAVQYAVRSRGFDAGIIITASHNPPEYNGVKLVGPYGIEVERSVEKTIEEIFFEERFRLAPWPSLAVEVRPEHGVNEEYAKAVVDRVDAKAIASRGYRVVVDCANSVSALTTPLILRMLGVKTYTLNCNLDPFFPAREPEPTPDTLRGLSAVVTALGADLGIGHDGDGDRAILVDERGRVWWGDRTGTLLAAFVAEKHPELPRRIYTAVSSSTLVEEYLKPLGIEVRWTPVGAVHIAYRLLREGGLGGFEENGGYIHPPHQLVRDGGMVAALFLELMAREGKTAGQLHDQLPKYHAVKLKIPMSRDQALKAVEVVKEHYSGYRQVDIDGVKVFGDDWWVLVRPSGTEPVLRIMAEARTAELAKKVAEEVANLVQSRVGA